jgi:hypothetical protein
MCNLNNIIESEKYLSEYSQYMDFIFNKIISENKERFNKVVRREDIELGHIQKYEGKGFEGAERWFFHYTIKFSSKKRRLRTTNQIGFNEWMRIKIVNERDKKIDQLLEGLSPIHAEKLKRALKDKK